jgi:branched-chain amino acid transport system permease protein
LSQPLEIFGVTVPALVLCLLFFPGAGLACLLAGLRLLEDSRIGRAWAAIREDELAAKACGINTRNIKLLAFAMGASFGGLAGGLVRQLSGIRQPESFSLMESIMVLCMVVLGGMGHIPGVILGALVLTVLPEAFRHGAGPVQQAVFGQVLVDPENLRMLLFGIALVAVMLYRPSGLWPDPRHRQEFKSR